MEKDNNGWIDKERCPPTEADCDAWHCILVWHIFQGIMVMGPHNAMVNSFVTHWQPSLPPPVNIVDYRKE